MIKKKRILQHLLRFYDMIQYMKIIQVYTRKYIFYGKICLKILCIVFKFI